LQVRPCDTPDVGCCLLVIIGGTPVSHDHRWFLAAA
jgi:hypothetical protein